ncbi:26621_t:CDS:2, partial [Racocetra persica]
TLPRISEMASNRSQDRDARELPAPSVGDYIVGTEIGRGSFATVYKGYHKKTQKPVAIKSVLRSKLTKKLLENLESEIKILK